MIPWRHGLFFLALLVSFGVQAAELRGTGALGIVVERATGSVQVIDTAARESLGRIEGLGDLSHASAVFSPDQRHAFVFGRDGGLTKLDLLSRTITKRVLQAGNSIGGAISVHTRKADIDGGYSGYVDVDAGERGRLTVEGAFNIPMTDTFAMRLAGYHSQEDGFVYNFATDSDLIEHDKQGVRWSTAFEKNRLAINTWVEYETREQSGSVYRAVTEGDYWDTLLGVFGDAIIPAGGERDARDQQST